MIMFGFFKSKNKDSPDKSEPSDSASVKNEGTGGDVTGKNWEELQDLWGVESVSGAKVTRTTALQVAAVFACVRLIAGAIGGLPLRIYSKDADGSRSLDATSSLNRLLSLEPSPLLTAMVFWEAVVADLLLDGNGYAIIDRDRNGDIKRLIYVSPNNIEPRILDGRLVYIVSITADSEPIPRATVTNPAFVAFDSNDILHFPGLGWNGKRGQSVIGSIANSAIGNSWSADQFSGKFFKQGLQAPGYIRFPEKLTQDQFEMMREYWRKKVVGADNAHMPPIISEGGEFKSLNIKADDVQLLETRKYQVEDIARIFGVPPHMIGAVEKSTSWGTGIEQQSMGFVRYNLSSDHI